MTLGFIVHNRSQEPVVCGITNNTNPSASNAWYELHSGASTGIWPRSGWEDVVFKSKDGSKQKSLWVNRGAPALVYFNGFDKDITIQNEYRPEPGFTVINHTDRPIYASVTTNSGGSGNWFLIIPNGQESWKRVGWETVAIKNENDSDRKGIYINNRGSRTTVGFRGLAQDFEISHTTNNLIRDEHYAEAVRIADRSFAAQNSRASSPGGLLASVDKINALESITTGQNINLWEHNQIYTLALLINHLKYGLAEPAIVVSVSGQWVKVAAFTCEFDAIVVLGFPSQAIDQIAPGRQRPAVGTRLVAVSQFSWRTPEQQGVQADITPGPRSRDVWHNFHPIVAPYVTDDTCALIWERHVASVGEERWAELWEYWVAWKEMHGPNYFRLGAPSKVKQIASLHSDEDPPAYVP